MFQVNHKGANRIDVTLTGKLDSIQMRIALDELFRKAEGIEHGRMLYRIQNLEIPTLGALGVELARIPQLLRFLRRFERIAVLADREWLRKLSEIEGALFPGIQLRAFETGQEAQAEAWLAQTAPQPGQA
ncbi:STAS/SEC14 domain-containing protein [Zestomonas thermotolerans]|uniref:STAS/SEC14 domain-containing protein n=1 Tax=Zestomonas thermotolerans TaxID=157784 RepID=UPI0023F1D0A4|nr:STAS/SEC14 domain-containing protein [Pseudomonas thermotolerans]